MAAAKIIFSPLSSHWRFKDLTGKVFGQLTVLGFAGSQHGERRRRSRWWCQCTCGKITKPQESDLRRIKSCGCLPFSHGFGRHGERKTPEYVIWATMKQRCLNPKCYSFARYGGRGITICSRWQKSFVAFMIDMGRRPSPSHSIDRIDNDGPYCKRNCRWATTGQQNANKRSKHTITFRGRTLSLGGWARYLKMDLSTLWCRLIKFGWTIEETLTLPASRHINRPRQHYRQTT